MQSFLKENGYIWESGITGHYTYGPLGKALKNSIENYIRKIFEQYDFVEVDTPLILHKNVWLNSGHWNKFRDPVIYTMNGRQFRLDHLIEKELNLEFSSMSKLDIYKCLCKYNEHCKEEKDKIKLCNEEKDFVIEYKDLMMKTYSGSNEVGLRPETATATYHNFSDMFQYNGGQLPILIYQIGKSFRNEISPKHSILRGREFTQAEFQIILREKQKNEGEVVTSQKFVMNYDKLVDVKEWLDKYKLGIVYAQYILITYDIFVNLGIPFDKIRLRRHSETEKAFYALDAWDLEINLNEYGWTEIAGIHDRGSYDLRNSKHKGLHILEIAIGIDRLFYSIVDTLYETKTVKEGKPMLAIPYHLSSIQVGVMPLVKNKKAIMEKSQEVYDLLKNKFKVNYLKTGSIGKRYLKNSIKGVPYNVTIDYDSLTDMSVTVRDRDTEEQDRVLIKELVEYLYKKLYR